MDIQTITSAGKDHRAIYVYKGKAAQEADADLHLSFDVVSWALVEEDGEKIIRPVLVNINGEVVVAPDEITYRDDEFGIALYLGVQSPGDEEEVIQEWIEDRYRVQCEEN